MCVHDHLLFIISHDPTFISSYMCVKLWQSTSTCTICFISYLYSARLDVFNHVKFVYSHSCCYNV